MSFKPTQSMVSAAKRGLALRKKWNRGGLDASEAKSEGVGSGVARARDIINGNLSLDTVKRMQAFFSRHEKNYKPSEKESDGGPTAGTIAWLLWGGSGGKSWSSKIINQEEKKSTMKSADEVLKQALYVVLVPDEVDAHGDIYSVDTVRKAKESFNKSNPSSNLFHLINTDAFSVIESYTLPADTAIADELIKEGTWLMKLQFNDDNLFADVLAGKYSGVSIGAMAKVKNLE